MSPVEVLRLRPWSAFAQVASNNGTVYFKALAPDCMYEVPLTQALARWRPDCTVPLLGVDAERGWLLSADAGPTLHAVTPDIDQVEYWMRLLPFYVELQIEMAQHMPELLALGLFDRRLVHLPGLYDGLMNASENLRIGLEPGLTAEEHQRLIALSPRITAACEELASYGLPETLVHEEVHSTNVLLNGDRFIFIDWSEGVITHPFFSMLVTLRATADRLEVPEDGPEMRHLRDAFLEPWTAHLTREKLDTAFDLAYRLAMVNRALAWHHGTGSLAPRIKEPYADAVPEWLREFLRAENE